MPKRNWARLKAEIAAAVSGEVVYDEDLQGAIVAGGAILAAADQDRSVGGAVGDIGEDLVGNFGGILEVVGGSFAGEEEIGAGNFVGLEFLGGGVFV
jgi:hypothetical protein